MSTSQQNPQNDYPESVLIALEKIEELKLAGRHEESIQEAQKLLVSDPDCVAALEEIADNFVSLNDFEKAEKASVRALSLDPESYTAHYILGFVASNRKQWSAAIDFLSRANELHQNNAEILRCLGWALFNGNKRTQGIVVLERALNLDTENSLTLCDLGICYLQTKNFEKSIELLKKAVEIDPSNKRARECYEAALQFSDTYRASVDERARRTPSRRTL
jgi:Tfp pilus assembly protein PilF